ncbi:unnamed protein product [Urochloa humidicola]
MMEAKKTKRGGAGGVSLPEDIIFDVLSWLPVRSLCRFRCVCKAWRAVISDPAFAATHEKRSGAAPLLAGVFTAAAGQQSELRVMDTDGNVVRVVKDVEGTPVPTRLDLVCLDGGAEHGAQVIDPATGRAVTVVGQSDPACLNAGTRILVPTGRAVTIGDRRGLYFHRFGRAVSGAYKVVRCHFGNLLEITTVPTAAGEPTTWRRLPAAQPAIQICPCHGCTAAVNGVLHFLTGHRAPLTFMSRVARLDLETEEWKTMIEAPPASKWPNSNRQGLTRWETTIGELKGTLSMVETIETILAGTYTNIWLLDPEKGIWVREYVIPVPRTASLVEPLEVLGDGTILLLSTFGNSNHFERNKMRVLQLYDPSTRVCKDLMKLAEEFSGKMALHTGSLLSSSTNLDGSC